MKHTQGPVPRNRDSLRIYPTFTSIRFRLAATRSLPWELHSHLKNFGLMLFSKLYTLLTAVLSYTSVILPPDIL
jgi:hypothetical protein